MRLYYVNILHVHVLPDVIFLLWLQSEKTKVSLIKELQIHVQMYVEWNWLCFMTVLLMR